MFVMLLIVAGLLIMAGLSDRVGPLFKILARDFFSSSGFLSMVALIVALWVGSRVLRVPAAGGALITLVLVVFVFRHYNELASVKDQIEGTKPASGPSETAKGKATDVSPDKAAKQPAPEGQPSTTNEQGPAGPSIGPFGVFPAPWLRPQEKSQKNPSGAPLFDPFQFFKR